MWDKLNVPVTIVLKKKPKVNKNICFLAFFYALFTLLL